MEVGSEGMRGLVTYPGPDLEPDLLTKGSNSAENCDFRRRLSRLQRQRCCSIHRRRKRDRT